MTRLFRGPQQTGQKLLDAFGLTDQHVTSLVIEIKPGSLIRVTVETCPDADKLDKLEDVITTEFNHYQLTPIDTKEE